MTKQGRDIYAEVTDSIIAQLERGVRPWEKSWKSGAGFSLPKRANGERYRGINVLLLWGAAEERGYTSPTWMTFNQAKELGGSVRKGERSCRVVYYNKVTRETETDNGTEEVEIPFLRQYAVFNVEQIDGLPEHFYPKPVANPDAPQPIEAAEAFFAATGAEIRHGGSRAYCSRATGHIQMPHLADFVDAPAYYATLGHETVHWSGHEGRLGREFGRRFGDKAYAAEELVAEIGAAFLAADLGLYAEPREDHASYLASWLEVLKADKKAIFHAASKAQQAADFLNELVRKNRAASAQFVIYLPDLTKPQNCAVTAFAGNVAQTTGSEPAPVLAQFSGLPVDPETDPDGNPPKGGRKPSRREARDLYARACASHKRADWRAAAHALAACLDGLETAPETVSDRGRDPAPEPAPAISTPPSLIEFLSMFGVRDDGGDLTALDAHLWHKDRPFRRRLIRENGISLEAAATRAWEAGFFPDIPAPTMDSADNMHPCGPADLVEAVRRELRGACHPDYGHALEDFERWPEAA